MMIYVSAMSLGKHSHKVTVLYYCTEKNIHHQKGVKSNFLVFRKTNINKEIVTYITEKLKNFKTS